ncbi:hypothetical protein COBT_002690, partial [Conglomerata obtusa]
SQHTNKTLINDMATAANALNYFSGDTNEDFDKWIIPFNLVSKILALNEKEKLQLLIVKIRGNAQILMAKYTEKLETLNLQNILRFLHKAFGNSGNDERLLDQLFEVKECKTISEYYEILERAKNIYLAKLMAEDMLAKLIISKLPSTAKACLHHHTQKTSCMLDFLIEARNIAWCIFPNPNTNQNEINKIKMQENHKFTDEKLTPYKKITRWFCKIHDFCNHKTNECNTIRKLQ